VAAGFAPALDGEGAAPVDAGTWACAALHPLLEPPARLHVRVQFMRLELFPALPTCRKKGCNLCSSKEYKIAYRVASSRLQILAVFTHATLVFCLFRRSSVRTTVVRPWKTKASTVTFETVLTSNAVELPACARCPRSASLRLVWPVALSRPPASSASGSRCHPND
jgi:hypothetical protein